MTARQRAGIGRARAVLARVAPARMLLAVLPLAGLAACAPELQVNGGPARIGEAGPDTISGTVRLVGNVPFVRTVVEPEDGAPTTVSGPYQPELERLVGAVVRVTGRSGPTDDGRPGLDATGYEILSVDGERPLVGVLRRDAEGFWLEAPGGDTTRVIAVTEPLASRIGYRVWLTLDENRGVVRYAILSASTVDR